MISFRQKVIDFIRKIPKGKVASYGQVAAACRSSRAARQVGAILRGISIADGKVPWWRVINNQGIISIKGNWTATKQLQKQLLEKDGVIIGDSFKLDIDKFRWKI